MVITLMLDKSLLNWQFFPLSQQENKPFFVIGNYLGSMCVYIALSLDGSKHKGG